MTAGTATSDARFTRADMDDPERRIILVAPHYDRGRARVEVDA